MLDPQHDTTPAVTTIGLVGCSSAKLHRAAPARELYTSTLFRKAAAYAEATCDRWYVLSAKHGLLHPDTIIEPYDVKLGRIIPGEPERSAAPIWTWAQTVADQLTEELTDVPRPELVILAGEQYRTITRRIPWPHTVPMEGLGIGQQLAWLTTRNTNERTA